MTSIALKLGCTYVPLRVLPCPPSVGARIGHVEGSSHNHVVLHTQLRAYALDIFLNYFLIY